MSNVTPLHPQVAPADQYSPAARAAQLIRRADRLLTPHDSTTGYTDATWQDDARKWLASFYQHPSAAPTEISYESAWTYEHKNGSYVITRDGKVIADLLLTDGVPFSAWIASELCKILSSTEAPDEGPAA